MQRKPEGWTEGENIGSGKSNRPGLNHESAMFNWVCGFRQSPTFPKVCLSHPPMGLTWECFAVKLHKESTQHDARQIAGPPPASPSKLVTWSSHGGASSTSPRTALLSPENAHCKHLPTSSLRLFFWPQEHAWPAFRASQRTEELMLEEAARPMTGGDWRINTCAPSPGRRHLFSAAPHPCIRTAPVRWNWLPAVITSLVTLYTGFLLFSVFCLSLKVPQSGWLTNNRNWFLDFSSGVVVKNPSASAGDTGLVPGPGRFRMLQSN